MNTVKKVVLSLASVVALSQPVMANEFNEVSTEVKVALESILANNIAEIEGTDVAKSTVQTFAKVETQLQASLLVAEAVKALPQTPNYKVIIAD